MQADSWATAWLITRLLLDGIPGTAGRRPTHLRGATRCWGCGAFGMPQWRWLSPADATQGSEQDGVAWCSTCCQRYDPCGEAPESPDTRALGDLPGPPAPETGSYRVCPLCGQGEAGSEHLAMFCPATRVAWQTWSPMYANWWLGWLHPTAHSAEHRRRALRFNHAIAFLICALGPTEVPDLDTGVRFILQQMLEHSPHAGTSLSFHDVVAAESPFPHASPSENTFNMWEAADTNRVAADGRCEDCCSGHRVFAQTWHGPHPQRGAAVSPGTPQAALRIPAAVPAYSVVLALRSHYKSMPGTKKGGIARAPPGTHPRRSAKRKRRVEPVM